MVESRQAKDVACEIRPHDITPHGKKRPPATESSGGAAGVGGRGT